MKLRCALCLPGGGLTGALYQVGALAALEDGIEGLDGQAFSLYLGHSTGATVAAAIAGGIPIDRIYRALLDPVDNFFPLERAHVFHIDLGEWQRTLGTGFAAIRNAVMDLASRDPLAAEEPSHLALWEQIERLYDSLPPGVFALDRYERFLAEFFARRSIPNTFRAMPRRLRIPAHEIDSGERVLFGAPGYEDVSVSEACAASLALPPFFSPVRVGDRYYIDGGLGQIAHVDVAEEAGAELAIVVNPMVPVATLNRAVPTGHGVRDSVRDKGALWVFNQALRISAHARLHQDVEATRAAGKMEVLVLEPEPTDALLFLHNPANLRARRAILEYAYRTTRERIAHWLDLHRDVADAMGFRAA